MTIFLTLEKKFCGAFPLFSIFSDTKKINGIPRIQTKYFWFYPKRSGSFWRATKIRSQAESDSARNQFLSDFLAGIFVGNQFLCRGVVTQFGFLRNIFEDLCLIAQWRRKGMWSMYSLQVTADLWQIVEVFKTRKVHFFKKIMVSI